MTLEQLDAHAQELAEEYLHHSLNEGKSLYTFQSERAALRLFFEDRTLAQNVVLPRRTQAVITRSRLPVSHDRHIQPDIALLDWYQSWEEISCSGMKLVTDHSSL